MELQERASTTRCVGSHNPQMLLPSLHWSTITMKKHQDQNGSRANSRTSTSATTYQLRTTGRLDHYRNRWLQETAGEKSTAKWKITTLTCGYQRRSRRRLEFEREWKVLLYPEIIFRSYSQFTKLRPYATFFGIWQILNDYLPNH
jgi:hypothetical protein